jgi:hypothetical protein
VTARHFSSKAFIGTTPVRAYDSPAAEGPRPRRPVRRSFPRRFFRSVPTRRSVPPKYMVDRILIAARRLSPASQASSWIAAWALADRGWRTCALARALGTDHRTVILAIVRVRNTPEFLALASSLLRSLLSDDCAHRPDRAAAQGAP